jgi:pyruvate formate lyase activating enzyme
MSDSPTGILFDLDTFAVHDGPGIRMAVYLKGCPLRCAWCHSPESQSPKQELLFMGDRCGRCGSCVAACPNGVHALKSESHEIDRSSCGMCGACIPACPNDALKASGYVASADSVVERAIRMKPFFRHSGGGVTVTGGEATMQADFTEAVLQGCRNAGIHAAMETCGLRSGAVMDRLAALADLILFDLKLIDPEEHRRWTGASNATILENATRMAGRNVQVRIPLIPGITDTEENLRGIFAFMRSVGLKAVDLLRFNASTGAKYEWLGRQCEVSREVQTPDQLNRFAEMAGEMGLSAAVV